MEQTTNLKLNKPGYDDVADIEAINQNMDIVNGALQNLKDTKSSIDSPKFIGTPTATTADDGDNSNRIATTSFTANAIINNNNALYVPNMDVIDGNFQVTSIGGLLDTDFHPVGSFPIWDLWKGYMSDANCFVSRKNIQGQVPGSSYCAQLKWTSAMNLNETDPNILNNNIFGIVERGVSNLCTYPKLTVSFWAKAAIDGIKLAVKLAQHYGTGGSPTATETPNVQSVVLSTNWKRYSVTFTPISIINKTFGTNSDERLLIYFGVTSYYDPQISGWIQFTQTQVDVGEIALPYRNKSFASELQACMRYFERSYDYGTGTAVYTYNGIMMESLIAGVPAGAAVTSIPFKVPKVIVPTITLYNPQDGTIGTWRTDSNANPAVSAGYSGKNSFNVLNASGANFNSSAVYGQWVADARG